MDNLILNKQQINVGLGTAAYTVPTGGAGIYSVLVQSTESPPSGLAIVVEVDNVAVFTAPTIGQTQSAIQFQHTMLLADADVVEVILSSAVAIDATKNAVKTAIAIIQGQ